MAINTNKLAAYIKEGQSLLIVGPAGTGKTQMLRTAVDRLGWKMKYFSTSTLDPFAHLIGVPVPIHAEKRVEFFRPRDIDEAEVIFFDELNRADSATLNAVFEIIQFHSINGEPLPKLKAVVAAINPVTDEYDTERLDLALQDRFDLFLTADVVADYTYFKNLFGEAYARVGVSLFNEYQKDYNNSLRSKKNPMGYFSPRRLEKLMTVFQKFPTAETIGAALPSEVVVSKQAVSTEFRIALGLEKTPKAASIQSNSQPVVVSGSVLGNKIVPKPLIDRTINLSVDQMRSVNSYSSVQKVFSYLKKAAPESSEFKEFKVKLLKSLTYGKSADTLYRQYSFILGDLDSRDRVRFLTNLSAAKGKDLVHYMKW